MGADECEQCWEGQYNDQEANIACDMCPAGTFSPDVGYWECEKCPPGQIENMHFFKQYIYNKLNQVMQLTEHTGNGNCPLPPI